MDLDVLGSVYDSHMPEADRRVLGIIPGFSTPTPTPLCSQAWKIPCQGNLNYKVHTLLNNFSRFFFPFSFPSSSPETVSFFFFFSQDNFSDSAPFLYLILSVRLLFQPRVSPVRRTDHRDQNQSPFHGVLVLREGRTFDEAVIY